MENLIGKTLGQYQILELAGKGGMAIVYKAYQPSLNRYVALKVLPDYLAHDEQFVKRFEQEARAAAALRHPNIMVIYDVGREGNTHYIAAEFLEGQTLAQVIAQQHGALPLARTAKIMSQVASALDFAHQRGLVHRDVKPSNVFIGPDDHVTLMDFGIVKALIGGQQMTRTGAAIGTPEYMSPEQAQSSQIDQRSDIYSMGVMLFEMLTGQVPFTGKTPTAILLAHVTQPPPLPTSLNPSIPRSVEAVVLRALAKQPSERFSTAGEMAQALERALTGASGVAPAYLPPTAATVAPPQPAPGYVPPAPSRAPQPPYTSPPPMPRAYTPPPARAGGKAVNWMLWGGLGAAAIALICVLGFVFVYVLGSIGGDSTPTSTAPVVARATSTPTSYFVTTPHSDGILLNDDFSSQKISEENGWVFDTGENVDWSWATNRLIATVKRKQWIGWNTVDGYYDDFGAETEAQAATNEYAEYGIIFRITGSSSEDRSYYIFGVSTTGKYFLEKRFAGAWAKDPVSATASTYIKQGTGKNRLGVIAEGSRIWLFINGYQVKTITDDSIFGGEIGVYSGTGDNDTTKVIFNRFTIMSVEKAKAEWGAK